MGHPAEGQQRVRSRDGRRAGRVYAATRSRLPAGLRGRDLKTTHRRDARADPDETRASGPFRLRVRAQRHRQSLYDVFPARRLASRQSHRSPHRRRLRSRLERLGRRSLPHRQDHRSGPGQSQHPQLYEAFPAPEARRLVERFEWHYTPKHGSWLDLAESELGVLASQCLDRRIADKQTLIDEIEAWEHDRNAKHTKANWHFTTPNARIKLKHLYPSI